MSKFDDLIKGDIPVLVDFHATWCGPCQTMSPIVQDIKSQYGDKIKVIKIDVDKNQAAAQRFKVRGVPTFILFKKGEIEWKAAGVHTRSDLRDVIDKVIA